MKLLLSSLIVAFTSETIKAESLRHLKGQNANSVYDGTDYSFCSFFPDFTGTAISTTSPWDTGSLEALDRATATDEEIATALADLNVCGGKPGAVNCQAITDLAVCATTAGCKVNGAGNKCVPDGASAYTATWPDDDEYDITCSGIRTIYKTVAHGDEFEADSTCEDANGCTLLDGTTVETGDPIPDGSQCENINIFDSTDISCDSSFPEPYEGYYMCYNSNSPHLYPRTICQPNDEEPPDMIDASTFASCGWCCQGTEGENQWTNDSCESACDYDLDGNDDDGFLIMLANGKNQKKDGDDPSTTAVEKCIHEDEVADHLNQFWGSSCA